MSSASAVYHFDLPMPPAPRRHDEFLEPSSPRHPCHGGHSFIWRHDERKWRCTRCGNPDMTGRPGPVVPAQPMPSPTWPTPAPTFPAPPLPYNTTSRPVCLFDGLSPEDRGKPTGLSCSCPRCSPRR